MDSLHVICGGQVSSKTPSRSVSPCRLPTVQEVTTNTTTTTTLTARNIVTFDGTPLFSENPTKMSNSGSVRGRQRSPTTHKRDKSQVDQDEQPSTPQRMSGHIDHTTPVPEDLTVGDLEDALEFHLASASFLSNGSGEAAVGMYVDEPDTSTCNRIESQLLHLQNKIARTKDLIRQEQTERDENVNEYLKLAANAANSVNTDKQQLARIKAVFEKKNQKSAHVIAQLQKKLESYNKRVKELESASYTGQANSTRQPRAVLRDVGQGLKNVGGNIRDGITGFSGSVMSKPREFAHLIKNKFGSADNINQLSTWYIGGSSGENSTAGGANSGSVHHGSATLPAGVAATGGSHTGSHSHSGNKYPSEEGSECSSVTSESMPGCNSGSGNQGETNTNVNRPMGDAFSLKPIFNELQERREEYERLRERIDELKNVEKEVQFLNSALQEERFRCERLEEQINDLTELHQNEVENLKQALADMEEKVQYQSEERLRDIHEMLENCQTKICKMEHQALQQQQYVTLEGLDNSNARALVVKLINVVLTVLQVILLLVATAAGITMPFLRTRVRILTTILVIFVVVFVLKQWPEVRDIGSHMMRNLKETLDVK